MAFEFNPRKKIAVIGGGVSGLGAAYRLSPEHSVTLFEADTRLGGHARTKMAGPNRDIPVDTGFIVYNYANYPELTKMFAELDVPVKKSDMSFSASLDGGRLEYGLRDFATLAAQKSNMLRPGFWRMCVDIARFNKNGLEVAQDPDLTLGEFIKKMKLGDWFRDYYLLPLSGAIWSTTPEQMMEFPAKALLNFFDNHALMSMTNHQWYTVDGGSIEYVKRIEAAIRANGAGIYVGTPVKSVSRSDTGVTIEIDGASMAFDEVVFASHSDQALSMLVDPTAQEQEYLRALRYQPNTAVLHSDTSVMPKRKKVWASWSYVTHDKTPRPSIGLSYWMNLLQGIDEETQLFMTLNPGQDIDPNLIYDTHSFDHPVFDKAALKAQEQMKTIQGQNNTWFAGAYLGMGFHEDGFASGVAVAHHLSRYALAA